MTKSATGLSEFSPTGLERSSTSAACGGHREIELKRVLERLSKREHACLSSFVIESVKLKVVRDALIQTLAKPKKGTCTWIVCATGVGKSSFYSSAPRMSTRVRVVLSTSRLEGVIFLPPYGTDERDQFRSADSTADSPSTVAQIDTTFRSGK
jgi:hypothetical protein